MAATTTPIAASILSFLAGAPARRYPPEVLEAARMCLVDWFGAALGAVGEPAGEIAYRAMQDEGPALVLPNRRASRPIAALVNGTLAHALDFDDTHVASLSHISAPTWSAILALASTPGADDSKILDAFITGFEVGARLGRKIGPALLDRRLHATAIVGTLAAAAAGCALLGLDETAAANAMGLAATQAGGLTISFGTMAKPFHAGKAAMNGVLAVQLARAGFTASHVAFDDAEGLARAVLQDRSFAFEPIDDGVWQILQNTFKPYASCLLTHASIDCAREISRRARGRTATSVTARVHPLATELAGKKKPGTPLEGKFSLAFCIALGLGGHAASAADFTSERLNDEGLAAIADCVVLQPDRSLRETAAEVMVEFDDGGRERAAVAVALGNPENPMHWADMDAKFNGLVSPRFGAGGKDLFDKLRTIDSAGSLSSLRLDPQNC